MARIWTCGFETGGNEHNGPNSAGVGVVSAQARTGAYSMRCPYYIDVSHFQQTFSADYTELYFRLALRTAGLALDFDVIEFRDVNGAVQVELVHDFSSQQLKVRNGAGAVLGSGSVVLGVGVWYVIEGHVVIHDSAGVFTVKVNSVTDISVTGADTDYTDQGAVRAVRFCNSASGLGTADLAWFDDIAVNDTSGSYQNSWIGLGGVFLLKPNADGAETDFTPSGGTDHFALVDETPANTSDWVQGSTTAEDREIFGVEACPDHVTDVDLLEVVWRAAIVESGSNTLKGLVRQATTNYLDAAGQVIVSIAPDYVLYKSDTHYVQPDGVSGAWDDTAVDAVQVGVEVV